MLIDLDGIEVRDLIEYLKTVNQNAVISLPNGLLVQLASVKKDKVILEHIE